LQEFPAENVFKGLAQQFGFGRKQRPSEWRLPPGGERGVAIENAGTGNWHDVVLAKV
jgi:hypothetical protein